MGYRRREESAVFDKLTSVSGQGVLHWPQLFCRGGLSRPVLPDATMAFDRGAALGIEDRGKQVCQAHSSMIPVEADRRYFVSLRLRIDADSPGRVVVDLQSFTADGALRGGARPVATVQN